MNRSSSRLKDSASKNSTVKRKVANRKGNVVKHSPVKGKAANRKGSAVKTSTVKGKAVKTSTVKGKAANRKQDELHKTGASRRIDTDISLSDTSVLDYESMMTRSSKKLKNAGEVKSSSLESTSAKDKTDKKMATGSAETKNIAHDSAKTISKCKSNSDTHETAQFDARRSVSNNSAPHDRDPKKEPTILRDWVIKPVPDCHGICVEGQIQGQDDFWHSTAIAKALEPKLVVTASGSLYKLKGGINKLMAFNYGISKDVAKAFAKGFPLNWEKVIEDYYQIMEQSITVTQECMSPEKFRALKTKRRSIMDKTIVDPVDIHTILTPTGLLKKEMKQSELTTTRSGRISLPPLAGWAGQYYVKRPEENSVQVSFNTDAAKQFFGKETMQALALSKRDQSMLCRNTLSKSLLVSQNASSTKLQTSKKKHAQNGHSEEAKAHNKLSHSPGKENCLQSAKDKGNVPTCTNISKNKAQEKKSQQKSLGKRKEKGQQAVLDLSSFCDGQPTSLQNPDMRLGQAQNDESNSSSTQKTKTNRTKLCGRSKKRKRDVDGQSEEESRSAAKVKKAKPNEKPRRQKLDPGNDTDKDTWTETEKDRFHGALRDFHGDDADYWSLVSKQVGTKSEQECQLYHREFLERKTNVMRKPAAKKSTKPKGKGREKGGVIRGGKGTLKRKQDIRAFLNEQNEDYEDDLFEGTPFVKIKQNALLGDASIDFNKEDSEIFGTNHNFFTPVAGKNPFDTPGLRFKARLASVRKTPANQTAAVFKATPASVDWHHHDVCIKNFMDQKKKALSRKVTEPEEDLDTSVLPIKSLFPGTPKIFADNVIEEEPEDEEDDDDVNQFKYYFSDVEDD